MKEAVHVSPEHPPLPDFNTLNLGKFPFVLRDISCKLRDIVDICINTLDNFYANLLKTLMKIQMSFSEPTANTYFVDKGTFLGLLDTVMTKRWCWEKLRAVGLERIGPSFVLKEHSFFNFYYILCFYVYFFPNLCFSKIDKSCIFQFHTFYNFELLIL